MLIPILDEIIGDAAAAGVEHVIAMARPAQRPCACVAETMHAWLLAEFEDPLFARSGRDRARLDGRCEIWRALAQPAGASLIIAVPPNPSHLEAVDPVLGAWLAPPRAQSISLAFRGSTDRVLGIIIATTQRFPGKASWPKR